jgi:hypothetical protein
MYDESADGWAQVREASERAKARGKRVLVMWGENGCGFCAYLSDLIWHENPGLRTLVATEYEVVKIDVLDRNAGKPMIFTKHNDLQRRYGATNGDRLESSPTLTIIDPIEDRGVGSLGGNAMTAKPMTMEKVYNENAIFSFLDNNKPAQRAAIDIVESAAKKALFEEKAVLAYFGTAPAMCEPCAEWEAWLSRAEVKRALEKAFAAAWIDPVRTIAGQSMLEKLTSKQRNTAPALSLLSDRGQPMDPPMVFDHLPRTADEVKAFVDALKRAGGKKLGDAEINAIAESLKPAPSSDANADKPTQPAEKK